MEASSPIFLDHHSTTPCDELVIEAMLPWMREHFGNPHSSHAAGRQAADAIQHALQCVASLLNCNADQVVLTSGATESIAMALAGVMRHPRQKKQTLLIGATEHPATLDIAETLGRDGYNIKRVRVHQSDSPMAGTIDLDALESSIDDDTALVSLMAANNEMGAIHPLDAVSKLCRDRGVLLHCDATQAIGRIGFDLAATPIDLVSFSAHKFYGPMGVGGLIVGAAGRRVRLRPLIVGGGQQQGRRGGTVAVPLVVGLGRAAQLADQRQELSQSEIHRLRDRLWSGLSSGMDGLTINGPPLGGQDRLPGNLNVKLPLVEGEALLSAIGDEVAFSTGSACSSTEGKPSHALLAMGLSEAEARQSIRLGIGRDTTYEEIESATKQLIAGWQKLSLRGTS
ncbi:MAG: cysteine desulfurase family protein [Planctomycetota bacterium]